MQLIMTSNSLVLNMLNGRVIKNLEDINSQKRVWSTVPTLPVVGHNTFYMHEPIWTPGELYRDMFSQITTCTIHVCTWQTCVHVSNVRT